MVILLGSFGRGVKVDAGLGGGQGGREGGRWEKEPTGKEGEAINGFLGVGGVYCATSLPFP